MKDYKVVLYVPDGRTKSGVQKREVVVRGAVDKQGAIAFAGRQYCEKTGKHYAASYEETVEIDQ